MRQGLVAASWAVVAAIAAGIGVATTVTGCAVSDSDVHRWETTAAGPEKLYAIVTHDKYSFALRAEAALSLIRMSPRNGKRVGLEFLITGFDTPVGRVQGALSVLGEDARRHIVGAIAPTLIEAMAITPPKVAEGAVVPPDPSVSYKDAAFGLISHEPPLAGDEKTKSDLVTALTQWVQTDFEDRIDNGAQQFGVEQIMRFIGAPSVKQLPSVVTEGSTKIDRACSLVADIGDDDTKRRASDALVALGRGIDSPAWMNKQRALVLESNEKQKFKATDKQVQDQLEAYQEQELERVFANFKRVGGRPAVEFCLAYARDKSKSEKIRKDALAALENRIDKNSPSDVNGIYDIVSDDSNPDAVRGVAMARLGELPKEMILPKLYALFDKKWQVRLDAGRLILQSVTVKDVPEFLHRLPTNEKTKMGLSEPITYGTLILRMESPSGPKPRDLLNSFLQSGDLGAKLTAAGSYYGAKKADAAGLKVAADDKTPVSKCDPADQCGWQCDVPKSPGATEKETKTVATVGDFVRWCIEPSLE
jgi:hypothetical protein